MDNDMTPQMTYHEAISVLTALFVTSGNDKARSALAVLIDATPPGRLGAAHAEAAALAQQFRITGAAGAWQTPPQHSEAMERLVHRLTVLLETMIDLLNDARALEHNHD